MNEFEEEFKCFLQDAKLSFVFQPKFGRFKPDFLVSDKYLVELKDVKFKSVRGLSSSLFIKRDIINYFNIKKFKYIFVVRVKEDDISISEFLHLNISFDLFLYDKYSEFMVYYVKRQMSKEQIFYKLIDKICEDKLDCSSLPISVVLHHFMRHLEDCCITTMSEYIQKYAKSKTAYVNLTRYIKILEELNIILRYKRGTEKVIKLIDRDWRYVHYFLLYFDRSKEFQFANTRMQIWKKLKNMFKN